MDGASFDINRPDRCRRYSNRPVASTSGRYVIYLKFLTCECIGFSLNGPDRTGVTGQRAMALAASYCFLAYFRLKSRVTKSRQHTGPGASLRSICGGSYFRSRRPATVIWLLVNRQVKSFQAIIAIMMRDDASCTYPPSCECQHTRRFA